MMIQVNWAQVRSGLEEISDADFQAEVWGGLRPGVMSSFEEAVETLFDDSALLFAMDRETVVSPLLDAKFRLLSRMCRKVDRDQPFDEFIVDESLVACRRLAAEISREIAEISL